MDVVARAAEELELADWRRRIAELYAEVRRLAETDPGGAHRLWREVREQLYREHPRSPVPRERRRAYRAAHFPYDPSLRFVVPVEPDDGGAPPDAAHAELPPIALPNSGAHDLRVRRLGRLALPFVGGPRSLTLYRLEGYAGGLFLPFRDATNGTATYGAGRYVLDTAKGADLGAGPDGSSLVVDLNFAYQPSCAFDPRWSCPLAGPEDRLDFAVRAGERLS